MSTRHQSISSLISTATYHHIMINKCLPSFTSTQYQLRHTTIHAPHHDTTPLVTQLTITLSLQNTTTSDTMKSKLTVPYNHTISQHQHATTPPPPRHLIQSLYPCRLCKPSLTLLFSRVLLKGKETIAIC